MDRRQLLHTLLVLGAGNAWAALSNRSFGTGFSIPPAMGREALLMALQQSRSCCESIVRNSATASRPWQPGSAESLKEISAFIDLAVARVGERYHHGPAFWQASADAFLRNAERLGSMHTNDDHAGAVLRQAEVTFRQTSQLLKIETVRTIASQ